MTDDFVNELRQLRGIQLQVGETQLHILELISRVVAQQRELVEHMHGLRRLQDEIAQSIRELAVQHDNY